MEPLSLVKGTAGVFQLDSPLPTLVSSRAGTGAPGARLFPVSPAARSHTSVTPGVNNIFLGHLLSQRS